MNLFLIRNSFTSKSTIGDLFINDQFECNILEDVDRNLDSTMTLKQILSIKIQDQTAIPYGKYEIAVSFSNRFQKFLPILFNVPGFEGVRIHAGNSEADTSACLLTGIATELPNRVINSRTMFDRLFSKIRPVIEHEKVFITISKGGSV